MHFGLSNTKVLTSIRVSFQKESLIFLSSGRDTSKGLKTAFHAIAECIFGDFEEAERGMAQFVLIDCKRSIFECESPATKRNCATGTRLMYQVGLED